MTAAAKTLAALLLLTVSAALATPAQSPPSQRLTPAQALNLRRPSDLHFSPDGACLAFTVAEPPHGADNLTHIWVLDVATRAARQYTYSDKSESSPRWSPDGRYLAFLSNRDGDRQIYLLPAAGGEASALTQGKRSIASFEWSPDGKQIAFLAPDEPSAAKQQKQKDKDDAVVVDTDAQHSRVWILDVATKQARAVTGEKWQVRQLAWLPDGNRLLVAATDRPQSDDNTTRLFSLDVSSKSATAALTPLVAPEGPLGEFRVSPDGERVAYIGAAGGPEPHDIFIHATSAEANDPSRDLSGASLDRAMSGLEWRRDGSLLATAQQGFESALYALAPDGRTTRIEAAAPNPRGAVVAADGTIAFVGASATQPPEVYLARPGAAAERVTHLNASWDAVTLAHPETFHFASFDGLQIEGRLLKPLDAAPAPYPLVVLVHGGPTGAWSDSIESWGQLLAAHGIAAAYFNIRGSTGYGEKFVEMNRADWGGADFKDVMAGVDYLVAQRIADPQRLGIGGWSYGGYMAEWAITQTDRFKAAVSGAGMVDLIAEFDTENGPAYDKWFWGLPYERADGFIKHSPFMYLSHAHTPILILQGIADTTDPLGQSTGLYRGLKFYGDKAELVEYPRENHGFREETHQLDRLNRIVAWYEQYLK